MVTFPLPLNGKEYGKLVEVKPYNDVALELDRQYRGKNFQ
jgi:hypothetical protein